MKYPYNVFGGLQDNGNWMGPSRKTGGIGNADWKIIGPQGDGFVGRRRSARRQLHLRREPGRQHRPLQPGDRPDQGHQALRQGGRGGSALQLEHADPLLARRARRHLRRSPVPLPLLDRGESWERISPDLTTDDPGAPAPDGVRRPDDRQLDGGEQRHHLHSISESPSTRRHLGRHRRRARAGDAGRRRQLDQRHGRIPGLPGGLWVSEVEASHHDEGTALHHRRRSPQSVT